MSVQVRKRGPRPAGEFELRAKDATKALARAGKRLDRAKEEAQAALVEVREAQAAWDKALEALGKTGRGEA